MRVLGGGGGDSNIILLATALLDLLYFFLGDWCDSLRRGVSLGKDHHHIILGQTLHHVRGKRLLVCIGQQGVIIAYGKGVL